MSTENHAPYFIKKRSCTNCCFLFVFFIFLAGWATLTFFAFKYGDPEQVFLPTDSKGSICGRGKFKNKPYLFYFNILKCAKIKSLTGGCDTNMVCVSKCPDFTRTFAQYKDHQKFDNLPDNFKKEIRKNLTCTHENGNEFETDEIPNLLRRGNCASLYIKSEPRFGRCLPSDLKMNKRKIVDDFDKPLQINGAEIGPKEIRDTSKAFALTFNAQALGELILSDLMNVKYFIIYGLLIGAIVSLLWILLMQILAGVMVWLSMIALIVLSGGFSFFAFGRYKFYRDLNQTQINILEDDYFDLFEDVDFVDIIKVQLSSLMSNSTFWLIMLITALIIFFLLTITFIALRQRVQIAISLIKEASKAIMEAKFTLFLPLVPYIFHLALFVFSVVTALLIIATYKPAYRWESGPNRGKYCDVRDTATIQSLAHKCVRYQLLENKYIYYVHGYNLFGFFWVWFFIHGMCQLVFAGVFSRYYWTFNKKKNLPSFLILNSTYTAFRYHVGSIALGSFLIATVKIIQVIIEYIDRKCKQFADNPVAKVVIWCMRCFFWLLDNFLRYINTNAYIMIAVYGKGYFTSAKDAFNLVLNNVVRAVVIDKVADYLLFFGKLAVTAIMGLGTYGVISHYDELSFDKKPFPVLNYDYTVPVAIISLGTYLIASSFFSVYEMAVNTIFLCFLKDCQENDGTNEKPYYMSASLLKILKYQNKTKSSSSSKSTSSISEETIDHSRSDKTVQ